MGRGEVTVMWSESLNLREARRCTRNTDGVRGENTSSGARGFVCHPLRDCPFFLCWKLRFPSWTVEITADQSRPFKWRKYKCSGQWRGRVPNRPGGSFLAPVLFRCSANCDTNSLLDLFGIKNSNRVFPVKTSPFRFTPVPLPSRKKIIYSTYTSRTPPGADPRP